MIIYGLFIIVKSFERFLSVINQFCKITLPLHKTIFFIARMTIFKKRNASTITFFRYSFCITKVCILVINTFFII